jgi:hypothetical protein
MLCWQDNYTFTGCGYSSTIKIRIMQTLQKKTLLIALVMLFASCQSSTDTKQILSKSETRKDMMDKIANDSSMSKEMMGAMMTSNTGMAMMQDHQKMMMENHETMMKMMKDNPGMMEGMMTNMMEACKNDTAMMSGMCKAMMGNKQMMDMMQKMKGMDMGKMKGMDTMNVKDHTLHH